MTEHGSGRRGRHGGREALLDALPRMSSLLLSSAAAEMDDRIRECLAMAVDVLDADLGAFAEISPADGQLVPRVLYARPGANPHPSGALAKAARPWLVGQLVHGQPVVLAKVAGLPPEAGPERAYAREVGLKSSLTMPVRVGEALRYGVDFGAVRHEIDWDAKVVAHVRLLGELLAHAHERAKTERALGEREAALQSLFDSAPIAIGLTTPQRVFKTINRYIEKLTGYAPSELVGKTPRVCYETDEEYDAVGRMIYGTLKPEGPSTAEFRLRRKDGTYREVLGSLAYLDPARPELGMVSTLLDVTELNREREERRRLESDLRQSQKLESLGRLVGGVAHDINNRLAPILFGAEDLRRRLAVTDEARRVSLDITRSAELIRDLVRQLLAFSRKEEPKLVPRDLGAIVEAFAQLMRRIVPKTVRLDVRCAPGLPAIVADEGQIDQVILNLAVNAIDAMPEGGTLRLETGRAASGEVVLTVADSGAGMTPEVQARAFEPFFTTKAAGSGTGLGLATVKDIVAQHGGRIDVESRPGGGTTIRIAFPTAQPSGAAAPPPPATP